MTVPAELAALPQWVLWRREIRDGKSTKVPYQPAAPDRKASSTDPATWGTLQAASGAAAHADGIGFVFTDRDPYSGVDLDACIDEDGALHPTVARIVQRLDSYTEFSPSQTGLHVLVRATVNGGRNKTAKTPWRSAFENYDRARFFCMTGNHVPGTPDTLNERQAQLDAIRAELLPEPAAKQTPRREPRTPASADDAELLELARNAKNGADFDRLWRGDTSGHRGDHSSADLALCGQLAFWTGPDSGRIDSLFRQSGLMRDKWDTRRGDSTYGAQTIDKALSGRTEFYGDRHGTHRPSGAPAGEPPEVTFTDDKTPKLVLPAVPRTDNPAALAAWITGVLRLDRQHPCTTATRYGRRGQDGAVKINRAGAQPIQFEPAAIIDAARRFIPALGWQLLPTDGEPYGFKDEHCRRIAHVLRLLAGIYETATEADRTFGIVGTFILGAEAIEGHTTYGKAAERYEAARVLRRELDEKTGRPIGPARYLIDANTGELVIRVSDLQEAARSHLGTTLAIGWLDARMDDIGWDRCRLSGHAIPGQAGRTGPYARIDVYRGLSPNTDEDDGTTGS